MQIPRMSRLAKFGVPHELRPRAGANMRPAHPQPVRRWQPRAPGPADPGERRPGRIPPRRLRAPAPWRTPLPGRGLHRRIERLARRALELRPARGPTRRRPARPGRHRGSSVSAAAGASHARRSQANLLRRQGHPGPTLRPPRAAYSPLLGAAWPSAAKSSARRLCQRASTVFIFRCARAHAHRSCGVGATDSLSTLRLSMPSAPFR